MNTFEIVHSTEALEPLKTMSDYTIVRRKNELDVDQTINDESKPSVVFRLLIDTNDDNSSIFLRSSSKSQQRQNIYKTINDKLGGI